MASHSRMVYGLTPLLLGIMLGCVASNELSKGKPWFCHDLDCPAYKKVNETDKYEVRDYKKSFWASTTIPGFIYSATLDQGFMRLFNYISGENVDKVKINMTAPVLTKVEPGDGPFCRSNFTISFFVPPELAESAPQPSNPDVYISSLPAQRVFVANFGGFLLDDFTLSVKAKDLNEAVKADGYEVEEGSFFTAGYDPPFRLTDRHNEIWLVEKEAGARAGGQAGTISQPFLVLA